jgi:cathepsin C
MINFCIKRSPKPSTKKSESISLEASALPDEFDWRNVGGVSYVSPVRNQGSCGSCYTFGSLAMLESRLRIMSFNRNQTIFSTQDIVECSPYSQGCDGGFPYLIAGKYAEDFGVVAESCNPYTGNDGTCHTDQTCSRQYATHYKYIGGFYGACNEDLMKIAIVRNGPIAVSFEVYPDFMTYTSGIYVHTGIKDELNFAFNPFELTNHVVAIVGYGEQNGVKYWIVKNSWGTNWGENGFFRIRRGTDECAIESIAVESFPLVR